MKTRIQENKVWRYSRGMKVVMAFMLVGLIFISAGTALAQVALPLGIPQAGLIVRPVGLPIASTLLNPFSPIIRPFPFVNPFSPIVRPFPVVNPFINPFAINPFIDPDDLGLGLGLGIGAGLGVGAVD